MRRLSGGMLIARRIREATAADCAGMLLVLVLLRRRAAVQVHAGCAERLRMLLLGYARGAALLLVRHAVGAQRGVRISIVTAATAGPHSSAWLLLHAAASSSSQRCGSHAAATVLAHPAAAHLMVLGLQTPHSASVYLLLAQHWCTHHPAAGASHRWCGAVIGLLLLLVQRVLAPHLLVVMVLLLVVVHVRRSVRGVRARRRIAAHNALVLHF